MSPRRLATVLALLAATAGGCGDDEPTAATGPEATGTGPAAETARASDPEEGQDDVGEEGARRSDDQDQPPADGRALEEPGADEATAGAAGPRIEVLLTARDRRVEPRLARVPAGLPISVELSGEPADTLTIDGRELSTGGEPVVLDPLPAGSSYTGRSSSGARVKVSATAEPGP